MQLLAVLATLLGPTPFAPRRPSFSTARPGGVKDVVVTKENTLNGTYHEALSKYLQSGAFQAGDAKPGSLPMRFINDGGTTYAYVTGLDSENRVVFVKADGTLVYPRSGGSSIPVPIADDVAIPLRGAASFGMTLPIALSSGRVYFSRGAGLRFFMVKTPGGDGLVQPSPTNLRDPSAGTDWGFVELTYTDAGEVFANISYVDFVGLILGMSLTVQDGAAQTTRGLAADAVSRICRGLADQTRRDGYPWAGMCVADAAGTPLRVLSPNSYTTLDGGGFQDYWSAYVDAVWSRYSQARLVVDTQSAAGQVSCRVSGEQLRCGGGGGRFGKPAAGDIWGCNSGPFERKAGDGGVRVAVIPRLCAAFVRSTLLLADGDVQPGVGAAQYYTVSPTSHYSRLVHGLEVDGRGYAFAYDDVNPDGEDASGLVSSEAPDTLTVYVGS